MSLSEKNVKIFSVLLIFLMLIMFYFIPYKKLDDKKLQLTNEINNLSNTYNVLAQDIVKKEEYEKGIEVNKTKINELNNRLPADLSQELMLFTLNDIEKSIDIKIPTASFSTVQDLFFLNDSTLDQTVTSTEGVPVENPIIPLEQETAIRRDIITTTVLSYTQLKELMAYLNNSENDANSNRMVLNNLALTSDTETGDITASFTLSFFGLAAEGREIEPIDLGTFDMEKDGIFLPFDEYGARFTIEKSTKTLQDSKADFYFYLDPITSDTETIVIGKTGGDDTSLVYSDSNALVDVEFEFYQANGKYYYKYKAGVDTYPENYSKGAEFDPGKAIEIAINSRKRTGDTDKSGANVTIINSTDMTVNLVYKGEDANNPRMKIVKTQGDVDIK